MSRTVRLINGKGDWTDVPPTGASDADLYQLANDFIPQGGVVDLAGGDALVTESDTPGHSVKVAKGTIYVPNSSWIANSTQPKFYQVVADAVETVTIPTNSSGSTRVDLVAQKIDKVTDPNDDATNVSPLVRIAGTPGDGAPSLPADHELLATLTLPDGYSAVTNSMISDDRRQVYIDAKYETVNKGFVDLVDAGTINIDLATKKNKFRVTFGGNRTFTVSNAKEGDTFYLRLKNDATARTPVWFAGITWIGIEDDPDMADYVALNKVGAFVFVCTTDDGDEFDGFFLGAQE
jgi:hypothetical protein